jgi:hypothetical protein
MRRRVNRELKSLYEADQRDRRGGEDWDRVHARDQQRRRRVEALIEKGALRRAEDYFHAAMVFQHGEQPDHFLRAHELAKKAAELGMEQAKWLGAAALDRWLMARGKPQKYGTQYQASDDRWILYRVDPTTTDEERAKWNVPPLTDALERAERMTTEHPPPPARTLPGDHT